MKAVELEKSPLILLYEYFRSREVNKHRLKTVLEYLYGTRL